MNPFLRLSFLLLATFAWSQEEQKTSNELFREGVAAFYDAKPKESVAAFDKLIERVPESKPQLWQRGLSLYYAGDYQAGREQFEVHQTVNTADVENAAWHFICVARAESVEAARKVLIPIKGDSRIPMKEVHELFAGTGSPEAVLKAAESGEGENLRNHRCYAHLYLGLYFEALGDDARAKDHMLKAAKEYSMDHYMGTCAQVHVKVRGWSGWEKLADPASHGWSVDKLQAARDYAATLNTEAVMIVVKGKVLDQWGPVDQHFNVHSIRKSFLSALYGIQVNEGRIKMNENMESLGVDDNDPGLTEVEKKATVADLLKARSGIYHPALYETANMKAARPQRHSHKPGEFWYYNNWDFNALGTIYEQKTRSGIYEDFKKHIADPIGMEDYRVEDGVYVTGEDSIHRAYPFRMTARDMARFGLLFLQGGEWEGKQVIPAAWVKESTASYSSAGSRGGYGYLWWIATDGQHLPGVSLPDGSYSARGAGGHYILVVPPLDLVIVHRVDTDKSGRRVEAAQFGELLRLILQAHETAGEASSSASVLDREMPDLMARHHVPGAAVVGIENRRVAWEKYYGVREAGKKDAVSDQTLFEAASMTKPLAVYAALKLVEQGQLDLDRPLTEYLPKPYLPEEPLHLEITPRMVMSHTGGFPNWRGNKPLKVMHTPGTKHLYSGEGILFLQRVMEHLTGEDLQPYLQRTLLQPLGMKNSSLIWQATYAEQAAAGHDDKGKVKAARKLYQQPNAAYSLYCTPKDYAAFVLEMMNVDRSAPHSLTAASLQAMLTPTGPVTDKEGLTRRDGRAGGDVRFGLGWSMESTTSGTRIRHGGSNGTGFRSFVEFDPKRGHGLIIMTNSTQGDKLWQDVIRLIGTP